MHDLIAGQRNPIRIGIIFRSRGAFLRRIVRPCCRTLGLTLPPHAVSRFRRTTLPSRVPPHTASRTVCERLGRSCRRGLSRCERLLIFKARPRRQSVSISRIPGCIHRRHGTRNSLVSFGRLTMERMGVFYPFNGPSINRITLISIPNLKSSGLNSRGVVLRALNGAISIIVFLAEPSPRQCR